MKRFAEKTCFIYSNKLKKSMKMKSYQSILKTLFSVVLLTMVISGCKKDFFNLEDPNGINSDIWNDVGAVILLGNKPANYSKSFRR